MTQVFINALASACLNLLIGVSFWLVYAPTRTFYISHAAAITLGAYGCYWLTNHVGLPLLAAICIAVIVTAFGFVALEKFLFQTLRSGAKSWVGLVASIGMYIVLQNLISLGFGDETLVLRSGPVALGHKIGNAYVTGTQGLIITGSAVLFASVSMLLAMTTLGRAIRGVASNPDLCIILGISPETITRWAIGIASTLAAVAGFFSALDSDMTPTMGFRLLMNGVVVMIIAGVGSISGLVWAALLLAITQHLGAYYLDAKWMDSIAFLILIGVLILKPLGFSGARLKKVEV